MKMAGHVTPEADSRCLGLEKPNASELQGDKDRGVFVLLV